MSEIHPKSHGICATFPERVFMSVSDGCLRDSHFVGIRREPGTEPQVFLRPLLKAGSLQRADADFRRSVCVSNAADAAFAAF